ncbi:uncharacterized protein CXQ87_001355 [Candidozyma duobushaemuli]|uniref:Uncharacterized protein n=1 Tax=Candidozyma duobushaemuli TaxID=1231522 RepID=A0A2V1AKN9_9ASCO|nr:uncharacterized protein CXQ87_001355 [[Candida] duobushaemulonis]PVH18428.1 hypothetical protein CXQ87_001355 [[Candida] duobushaemulonis]
MLASEISALIVQRVEERTDGFDKPSCGKTVREVCKPIPNDQPLPRRVPRFSARFFTERVDDYWDNKIPFDVITLKGASNYQEWRVSWDNHIEALIRHLGEFILHYHNQFKDASSEAVDYNRYRKASPKELSEACSLADYFLRGEINRSFDIVVYVDVGKMEDFCYHEILSQDQLIEKKDPHILKAVEAYSYSKRVNIIGTFESRQEHHSIYKPDWVVRVIGDSVDVTEYDIEKVAKVFEEVEEKNLRKTYEEAADAKRPISKWQMAIERRVREICFSVLGAPIPDDISDY